jgi:hypothetical protein
VLTAATQLAPKNRERRADQSETISTLSGDLGVSVTTNGELGVSDTLLP